MKRTIALFSIILLSFNFLEAGRHGQATNKNETKGRRRRASSSDSGIFIGGLSPAEAAEKIAADHKLEKERLASLAATRAARKQEGKRSSSPTK